MKFKLVSKHQPTGDQPQAIEKLLAGLERGDRDQLLLGVTGSGKTFTMANVIAAMQRPTLVMAHNKTLAAQLASEFRELFPENAVNYFVSYYDYYQPEAYLARTDTYIEKETTINEEIEKYRHHSTYDLLTRRDVIIVASVSAIYGLGSPKEYLDLSLEIKKGQKIARNDFLRELIALQYQRDDYNFGRSRFRVRGDIVEAMLPMADNAFRFEFWGEEIETIQETDYLTGEILGEVEKVLFMPAKHAITSQDKIGIIIPQIEEELKLRVAELKANGREVEAQRLHQRTMYDIDMLRETGYVNGIENYTRYLSQLKSGEPPYTLLDFFSYPDNQSIQQTQDKHPLPNSQNDWLLLIDESHMTVPQIGGMYEGNLSRKRQLIDYGFRLPSAFDNRPLRWKEFEERMPQTIYVSATPGKYELKKCGIAGGDLFAFLQKNELEEIDRGGEEILSKPKEKKPHAVFLHGMPSSQISTDKKRRAKVKHWRLWAKKELEQRGWKVDIPLVPCPWEARYEAWRDTATQSRIGENTVLIGNSAAAAIWIRWLAESRQKIKKLILIAPCILPPEAGEEDFIEYRENKFDFYNVEIDPQIKNLIADGVTVFISNDEERMLKSTEIIREKLEAKVIEIPGCKHFRMKDLGGKVEFSKLLDEILGGEKLNTFSPKKLLIFNFRAHDQELLQKVKEKYPDLQFMHLQARFLRKELATKIKADIEKEYDKILKEIREVVWKQLQAGKNIWFDVPDPHGKFKEEDVKFFQKHQVQTWILDKDRVSSGTDEDKYNYSLFQRWCRPYDDKQAPMMPFVLFRPDTDFEKNLFIWLDRFMASNIPSNQALKISNEITQKPLCLFMVGKPGAGKTTMAKKIMEKFPDFKRVSSDQIRQKLFKPPEFKDEKIRRAQGHQVFTEMEKQIKQALTKKQNIIIDAANANIKWRRQNVAMIKDLEAEPILVDFQTPETELEKRVIKRNKNLPAEDFVIPIEDLHNFQFNPVNDQEKAQIFSICFEQLEQDEQKLFEFLGGRLQLQSDIKSAKVRETKSQSLALFMSGKPLSGKTTLSKEILEKYPDFVWLSSDEMRQKYFDKPGCFDKGQNHKVFTEIHQEMRKIIRSGRSIIFDVTDSLKKHRQQDAKIVRDAGAEIIWIDFQIPDKELERRRVKRNKNKDSIQNFSKKELQNWNHEPLIAAEGKIIRLNFETLEEDKRDLFNWLEERLVKEKDIISNQIPKTQLTIVQQIIRPTGLLDPQIDIRPIDGQIDDLLNEIQVRLKKNERILITTITKKLAEELTDFLKESGLKVSYLHSEVDTLDRIKILRDLRLGEIDIIVGINLLREGLDLPEVSLVVILDADKQGFLRSRDALLQTIGRTARNAEGRVIMYANKITEAMSQAISETNRRRQIQDEYNKKHGITPQTIIKKITDLEFERDEKKKKEKQGHTDYFRKLDKSEQEKYLEKLHDQMDISVQNMQFEKAAELRDQIAELEEG